MMLPSIVRYFMVQSIPTNCGGHWAAMRWAPLAPKYRAGKLRPGSTLDSLLVIHTNTLLLARSLSCFLRSLTTHTIAHQRRQSKFEHIRTLLHIYMYQEDLVYKGGKSAIGSLFFRTTVCLPQNQNKQTLAQRNCFPKKDEMILFWARVLSVFMASMAPNIFDETTDAALSFTTRRLCWMGGVAASTETTYIARWKAAQGEALFIYKKKLKKHFCIFHTPSTKHQTLRVHRIQFDG